MCSSVISNSHETPGVARRKYLHQPTHNLHVVLYIAVQCTLLAGQSQVLVEDVTIQPIPSYSVD